MALGAKVSVAGAEVKKEKLESDELGEMSTVVIKKEVEAEMGAINIKREIYDD